MSSGGGSLCSATCSLQLDETQTDTRASRTGEQARRGDPCGGLGHCTPEAVPGGCCLCQAPAAPVPCMRGRPWAEVRGVRASVLLRHPDVRGAREARQSAHAGRCGSCALCTRIRPCPQCPGHLCSVPTSTVRHSTCTSLCRVMGKPELDLWLCQRLMLAFLSNRRCAHSLRVTLRAPRQPQ